MTTPGGGTKPFSMFSVNTGQAAANQPPTQAASAFNFGSTPQGGFNFGGAVPSAAGSTSAPQLSFTAATPATTKPSLFTFGTATPSAETTPFGAGSTSTGTTSLTGGVGGLPTATPGTLNFGLNTGAAAPPATAPAGITSSQPSLPSFGVAGAGGGGILNASATSAAPLNFGSTPQGTTTVAPQPTFGTGLTTSSTTATSTPTAAFTFGAAVGVGGTGSLGSPKSTTAATTATAVGGGLSTTATAGPGLTGADGGAAQSSPATATTQPSATNVSPMNFRQLQDVMNKWMVDLQDQEKQYLEHATKINARDMTLIANGDKISKLNESITKVKADHTQLEHALDYLKNQQQEFESVLEPLEAGLPLTIPVEPERENLYNILADLSHYSPTYTLAETVDTQLQQMSEDLKEVIRHINESNKTVDKNDPISQILKILNEHTDALQWVEDTTNQVRTSLDDISKHHQIAKKEHERTLRTIFKS